MEFIIESLWYIDNNLGVDVCQDENHSVYVIPKRPVQYSEIYAELDTFDKFYTYAHKKREETVEQCLVIALTYIYIKIRIKNSSMKTLLKGYRALRILAQEKKASKVLEMKKERKIVPNYIEEDELDSIFLESNTYLSNLKPRYFYKMEYRLAKYFYESKQVHLAYRYAKEALEVASRSAETAEIEETRSLLIEIEEEKNKLSKRKACSLFS